jgi:hypothetical protein
MPRLHINFTGPRDGWLGICIQAKGGEIKVNASYTPHDTVAEFAEALVQILESGTCKPIRINEEPELSVLQFYREGDLLLISHAYEGYPPDVQPKLIRVPFLSATREIARKLMLLYQDVGYNGWVTHWRHRPPKEQIARAWTRFAR